MSKGASILVVEDSMAQASFLQHTLEHHGYRVSVFRNGKEALESMKRQKPSIVISDVTMPEMHGYELCRYMKADAELKDVPVILLPQFSTPEDAIKCLECGASSLVTKPYNEESLLSCIRQILTNHKLRNIMSMKENVDISLSGRKYSISSDRAQILDFLISTYESAIREKEELEQASKELAEALEAIRILDDNYRKFLEMQTDAIVIVNHDGVIRSVNPSGEALFGRSAEEILGEPFDLPVYPDETREIRIEQADGRHALVETRVMETNWDGVDAYLVSLRDVTESRRVTEALKEIEERYKDLFENASDLIQSFTPDGHFLYVNFAWQLALGYSEEEVDELSLSDIVHHNSQAHFMEILHRAMSGEEIDRFDTVLVSKDGREIIVEGSINCKFIDGKPVMARGIFRDVTERTLAKEALEEGVKREAQAYAQGRLEVVDTILHNIGNAINSVAIGIGTIQEYLINNKLTRHFASLANAVKEHQEDFADYVREDTQGQKVAPFITALAGEFAKRDEELARIVSRVHERAEHIADIIRTEKTLSKRSVYRKDINLGEAIEDAITVLQDSIKKRNIQVSVDCDGAPKEISTQESQFHQMLVNLIKNSIEAIDELGAQEDYVPYIKIKCYVDTDFALEVMDNGIGIESDKLDAIFRSGYTTKDSGSGLGLHSIANFVSGCGGQILALSDGIGKGATMRILLPLTKD